MSQEKLRLIHENATLAEKFLTETLDFLGTYHLSSGNVDDEVSKQIVSESMKFSPEIRCGNEAIKSQALWINLTLSW